MMQIQGEQLAQLSDIVQRLTEQTAINTKAIASLRAVVETLRERRGAHFRRAARLARQADDPVRPPDAAALVAPQRSFRIRRRGQARPEHDRVLERLRRSLADVRLHWVRGVAE